MSQLLSQIVAGQVSAVLTLHFGKQPIPPNPDLTNLVESDWQGYQPASLGRQFTQETAFWCSATWLQAWVQNLSGSPQAPASMWIQADLARGSVLVYAANLPFGEIGVIPAGGLMVYIPVSVLQGN